MSGVVALTNQKKLEMFEKEINELSSGIKAKNLKA
jgi:hypothetical protein